MWRAALHIHLFIHLFRGLLRLRSAERLRRLIPSALASELKREIDAAASIVGRDPLLSEAVASYRAVLEP